MKKRLDKWTILCLLVGFAACAIAGSEIVANLTLKVTKGTTIYMNEQVANTYSLVCSNPCVSQYTLTVLTNTAGTAFALGGVLTNGVAWLQNLGTNWVDIGITNGSAEFFPLLRLKTNEAWAVRFTPGITPYARSTVTNVIIKQVIMDD